VQRLGDLPEGHQKKHRGGDQTPVAVNEADGHGFGWDYPWKKAYPIE
jgi:hypothetical protein